MPSVAGDRDSDDGSNRNVAAHWCSDLDGLPRGAPQGVRPYSSLSGGGKIKDSLGGSAWDPGGRGSSPPCVGPSLALLLLLLLLLPPPPWWPSAHFYWGGKSCTKNRRCPPPPPRFRPPPLLIPGDNPQGHWGADICTCTTNAFSSEDGYVQLASKASRLFP